MRSSGDTAGAAESEDSGAQARTSGAATLDEAGNESGADSRAEKTEGRASEGHAGNTAPRTGAAGDGNNEKGERGGGNGNSRVVLEFGGDPGTGFSGACIVGDERREIDGKVPRRVAFEVGGRKLECEISKRAAGALNITLVAGDDRHEQQTDARWSRIELGYSQSGFFSTVRTSGPTSSSSSSTSQTVVSSSSSSTGTSSSTNSR